MDHRYARRMVVAETLAEMRRAQPRQSCRNGEKHLNAILDQTILMSDINSENVCEFLIFRNEDEPPQKWVKAIPYYGMHEMYKHNVSNPAVVFGGMLMPQETFLGYIANLTRNPIDKERGFYWQMQNQSHRVTIRPGMSAKDIAQLTGFDLQKVKDFYRDFFVVQ